MNKLVLEVDVKVVTERVQKEIPLPLYLRIDENEYLHIDENDICCYMFIYSEEQHWDDIDFYQGHYNELDTCKREYVDRYLEEYENYICSEEEFKEFKKSLISEL